MGASASVKKDEEGGSSIHNVIDAASVRFEPSSLNEKDFVTVEKSDEVRALIQAALKGQFLFESLNQSQLAKLIDVFSPVTCDVGEKIIQQGQAGDFMYIIEKGHFEVSKEGEGKLTECHDGGMFGELALLYGARRSATVTCVKAAKMWSLDRNTFRYFQANNAKRISKQIASILKSVPLLKDVGQAQLQMVSEVAHTVDFKEGDVIIRKGEIGNTFYIVLEGVVNCSEADLISTEHKDMLGTSNSSALLQATLPAGGFRLKAGEWFGEIALMTGSMRTANVVADSSVKLIALDRVSFEKVLGSLKDIIDRQANNRMLQTLPIIANLPQDRREAAVDMFCVQTFGDGDIISKCGDPNPYFILMKAGRALAWKHPKPELLLLQRQQQQQQQQKLLIERQELNNSQMSMTDLDNSPKSKGQVSFDSLSTFEMPSISSNFKDTDIGKNETLFRHKIRDAAPEQKADEKGNIQDGLLKFLGEDASELVNGESVGADAVISGTPMDCTLIAQGNVSCFVLTRGDLLVLLEEEGQDTLMDLDKTSLENNNQTRVAHIDSHDGSKEIDWSSLKNLGKLGSGTFGVVYKMQDKTKNTYAMKVLNKKRVKEMKQEKRVSTEKKLLASMKSPFICKLFGINQDPDGFYLLLELVTGGELRRLIHPEDKEKRAEQHTLAISGEIAGIPHQPAKFYIACLSLPLNYLHRRAIAFRDLKPENVMIDHFGYPKLIDFGLAKPLDESGKTYTLCGTPEFLAPEVILGHGHNQAVDWWALGVLLYEMIVGVSPFIDRSVPRNKQDQMTIFQNIVENRADYSKKLEPKCANLIQRLLTLKPAFRMGCGRRGHKEFEEHEWFLGVVDWYALNKRFVNPPWIPPEEDDEEMGDT